VSRIAVVLILALAVLPAPAVPQAMDRQWRERSHQMLAQVRRDLLEHYYDSALVARHIDTAYARVDSALDRVAAVPEALAAIAQFVLDLKDSHTTFRPPGRAATVEYGWRWDVIGDACFVSWVRDESDASQKGLAVGQRLLAIDGLQCSRQSEFVIGYLYYAINPRARMHVVVQDTAGVMREFDVAAKVTPTQRVVDLTSFAHISALIEESEQQRLVRRHMTRSFGDTVLVWRMRSFVYGDRMIDEIMNRARRHRALILDLRDNGGGSVDTEVRLLGHFFDRETKILTERRRDTSEARMVEPQGRAPFNGPVYILMNSNSASASEVTARVLQLEGKATVIGDRSAGALMTSISRVHEVGFGRQLPYGLSVTIQDVIMLDGNRIENVGVMPEFVVLPTGADLAAHRDPVMAKALELVGIRMEPADAATIFARR
jgi:hypothetical protein